MPAARRPAWACRSQLLDELTVLHLGPVLLVPLVDEHDPLEVQLLQLDDGAAAAPVRILLGGHQLDDAGARRLRELLAELLDTPRTL